MPLRRSSSGHARVLGTLLGVTSAGVLGSGCTPSSKRLELDVQLACPEDREHTREVALSVQRGTCAAPGAEEYAARLSLGAPLPRTPQLTRGPHAFIAMALDEGGQLGKGSCKDVSLPAQGSIVLELPPGRACGEAEATRPKAKAEAPGASAGCSDFRVEGRRYLYCDEPRSFQNARAHCQSLGAWDLAVIETPRENAALAAHARIHDPAGRHWLGAFDGGAPCVHAFCSCERQRPRAEGEGDWSWIAPSTEGAGRRLCRQREARGRCAPPPRYFVAWAAGQPDNAGKCAAKGQQGPCQVGCLGTDEDCLQQRAEDGQWNDVDCASQAAFICEASDPGPKAETR